MHEFKDETGSVMTIYLKDIAALSKSAARLAINEDKNEDDYVYTVWFRNDLPWDNLNISEEVYNQLKTVFNK